jgi:tetratricopeptide (TPR) repeat protein
VRGTRSSTAARVAALIAALVACAALPLAGCSPDAASHRERAEQYLAEDRPREALLELRSALKLEPNDAQTNFRIAQIAEDMGKPEDAAFFYGETLRLDPYRTDAALAEAHLIAWDDPDRTAELIQGVLEREPANALARVRMSEFELIRGDAEAALAAALVAVELAPDGYRGYTQLGIVWRAQIRELRSVGDAVPDTLFEQALAAFDRALALAESAPPDERLQIRLERAIVFVSWPDHGSEAAAAYREAVDQSEGAERRRALVAATRYARNAGDTELLRWSLELGIDLDPGAYGAWRELAQLEDQSGGSGGTLLESLLAQRPDAADAHRVYAMHLARTGRIDEATAHLLGAAEGADEPAQVLALAVELKLEQRQIEDARAILARLESEHPGLPATDFARAQMASASHRPDEAARILTALAERAPNPRVDALLARIELNRRALPEALSAVDRALELSGERRPPDLLRLKARIQTALWDWTGVLSSLRRLANTSRTGLNPEDRVLRARALYEVGRPGLGKRILELVLASEQPPVNAMLLYARRENRRDPDRARALLEQARARAPGDLRALVLLTQLDLQTGRGDEARARLDAAIERTPGSARLQWLRARVLASQGYLEPALADTRRALELAPDMPEARRLEVALLAEQGQLDQVFESLEASEAEGHLDPRGRLRLAQLYMTRGKDERAIELLEQALAEDGDLHEAKNDLAFLLTRRGEDLDRALQLAQEARAALPESVEVADTLGYAYLRKGLPEAALSQLEAAVDLAEARGEPHPTALYHLGLALKALGRQAEAASALERSLAIEGDFPSFPREEVRRELQALRTAPAAGDDSTS